MSYKIHITTRAESDIVQAMDYIEHTLKNADAAEALLETAIKQISSLADLPHRFPLADDPVLSSWGVRYTIIGNYLAFYTINEENNLITVLRFLYQKSSWASVLHQEIL